MMQKAQTSGAGRKETVPPNSIDDTRLLTTEEVADRLSVSISTLTKWRMTPGAGPAFIKLGARVAYRPSAIDAFLEANTHDLDA